MFVISKNSLNRSSLYRRSVPYILLYIWPGRRISFVTSRTSLNCNRGSLNRGSTVVKKKKLITESKVDQFSVDRNCI